VFGPSDIEVRWTRAPEAAMRREVAWDLLRTLLPHPAPTITNACHRCGEPHGRVRVEESGLRASVTYAGGYAIVCVAPGTEAAAVGVDAESLRNAPRDAAGLAGIVKPGAIASLRDWTRIEAVLKADGRGLRVDPALVSLAERGTEWSASVAGSAREFIGADVTAPPGIILSVAFEPVGAAAGRAAAPHQAMP
jgi:4'-phosphopantetheinyl transferase